VGTTWQDEAVWLGSVVGRVLVLLNRRRLNLSDLARISGIPYCTLYGYIRQGRRIPAFALWRMARALNVELSELAGSGGPVNPRTDTAFPTSENSNFQKFI
jgi:transcriptional regulator with XRE-family HTH domain